MTYYLYEFIVNMFTNVFIVLYTLFIYIYRLKIANKMCIILTFSILVNGRCRQV